VTRNFNSKIENIEVNSRNFLTKHIYRNPQEIKNNFFSQFFQIGGYNGGINKEIWEHLTNFTEVTFSN
jgi:hypothetical protein